MTLYRRETKSLPGLAAGGKREIPPARALLG
jgi:hypothetical protein